MTQTLLNRARAAIDTDDLERSLAELVDRRAATHALQRDPVEFMRRVAADVLAGRAVPGDLGAQLVAVRRGNEEAGAQFEVLRVIEEQVRNALQRRRQDGVDDAIGVLADELAAVVAEARPVLAALGDEIGDPAAAIAHDRAREWRQTVELAERHDQVRHAQRVLTSEVLAPHPHLVDHIDARVQLLVDLLGHVRRPEQWTDVSLHVAVGEAMLGGGRDPRLVPGLVVGTPQMRPDLAERSTMAPWLVDDRVAALRFIARPDIEAWVPTPRQLREARSQVEAWRPDDEETAANPADEAAYRQRVHFAARAHQVSG